MPNQTTAQVKLGSGINKPGKTARDHASGAWGRRLTNQETRKAWDRQTTASSRGARKGSDFPIEVCNGRDSRALKRPSKGGKHGRKAIQNRTS